MTSALAEMSLDARLPQQAPPRIAEGRRINLVYESYDWEPSETRELPEDDFDPGPSEWVLVDDDGNVLDRFANVDERD